MHALHAIDDPLRLLRRRCAAISALDQIEANEQSPTTHIADDFELVHQVHAFEQQMLADAQRILLESFLLDDIHDGVGDRAGDRIASVLQMTGLVFKRNQVQLEITVLK